MLERTTNKQLLSRRQRERRAAARLRELQRERRLEKHRRFHQRQREGRATAIVEFDHVTISWLIQLKALDPADLYSRAEIGAAITKVVDASKTRPAVNWAPANHLTNRSEGNDHQEKISRTMDRRRHGKTSRH
jgi:hypothetical protein